MSIAPAETVLEMVITVEDPEEGHRCEYTGRKAADTPCGAPAVYLGWMTCCGASAYFCGPCRAHKRANFEAVVAFNPRIRCSHCKSQGAGLMFRPIYGGGA